MKTSLVIDVITLSALFSIGTVQAQSIDKALPAFEKIIVSPLINLVLVEGDNESIRLEYAGIEPEKINYLVKGKTLQIYLDDAKVTVKTVKQYENGIENRKPIYEDVEVTAYVTYRKLRSLQVRGEENVTCLNPINQPKFKLKLYGESNVTLTSLQTNHLKASLFGQNSLSIQSGNAEVQRYRVYGENRINTENFLTKNTSTSLFGESQLNLNASDQLKVTVLGESDIWYAGEARLNKRLVLGKASIQRSNN